ncbi:probable pectinesterase/pectinesterase inhibitor 12, partial [Tanacetum coccineum]
MKAFLAAAVTNKNTCLEGLESASGPLKPLIVDTVIASYKHVINSLSLAAFGSTQKIHTATTEDTNLPKWLSRNKIFHINDDDSDYDDEDVGLCGSWTSSIQLEMCEPIR